jgi:hypothetical protein
MLKNLPAYEKLYNHVKTVHQSKKTPVEKWNEIVVLITSEHTVLKDIYKELDSQEIKQKINYKINENAVLTEKAPLVRFAGLLALMHHIIYDLMTQEGNYYFSLEGKKEIAIIPRDTIYYINISIKNEQNHHFHAFILQHMLESFFTDRFYVGLDYEFTIRKIQLAQLNFEHCQGNTSIIQIVSPRELESQPEIEDTFINYIICNQHIKIIMHGAASLDLVYMYENMLNNDTDKIVAFTKSMIDTLFTCEYYKLNFTDDPDSADKCSLKDMDKSRSSIYYFGVITEQKQEEIAEMLDSMTHQADYPWDIHRMAQAYVLYAQYDVIFLKYFYYRIIYKTADTSNDDMGKKKIMEFYKTVFYEMSQFMYLEKKGVTFLVTKCKEECDPINNYMVRIKGGILKLIDIYNKISPGLVSESPYLDVDKMANVKYFSKTLMMLIKKMVYTTISKTCTIHMNKTNIWRESLDNTYIYTFLADELKFNWISQALQNIEKIIVTRVREICPGAVR